MLTTLLIVEALLLGQIESEPQPKERPYWLEVAKAHIADCKVYPTKDPEGAFRLVEEPVFHHVQNTRGKSVGSVFLFVDEVGRPAAVGDVFLFPRGKQHQLYNEWHALASVPITVKWNGGTILSESKVNLTWNAIPDAPAAGANRTARQRQMRELARRFTAHLVNKTKDKYELRLLTTPLYQYSVEEQDQKKSHFLGGGLFAFCQETDPEIFLLLEAQRTDDGAQWRFAAAEFSNLSLFLHLDKKEVWRADPPQFSGAGPHTGNHLKDVALEAPKADAPKP